MNPPPNLPIIDSHHQLNAATARPAELAPILAGNGVQRSILIQPEPSTDHTRDALALADDSPFVAAAAVWADLNTASLSPALDQLARSPKLRGLCLNLNNYDNAPQLARDPILESLRETAARGLSLDIIASPSHIPSVRALAEAIPNLQIALAHLGSPRIARGEREPWGVHMLNLAPLNNISIKLSGLLSLDPQPQPNPARLKPFVETVIRLFGYSRLMFGSDWPAPRTLNAYRQTLQTSIDAASPIAQPQLARLLAGTAADFYRLD